MKIKINDFTGFNFVSGCYIEGNFDLIVTDFEVCFCVYSALVIYSDLIHGYNKIDEHDFYLFSLDNICSLQLVKSWHSKNKPQKSETELIILRLIAR